MLNNKAEELRERIKDLLEEFIEDDKDISIFILLYSSNEMFGLGHGCNACALEALESWIEQSRNSGKIHHNRVH